MEDVVDRFLRDAKVDIVPVDADLADRAMSGRRRYGKGRHPPGLNFGDCFAYALADRTGHPVLCTGNDFAATDITVVRPGTEQTGPPMWLSLAGREGCVRRSGRDLCQVAAGYGEAVGVVM